MKTGSTLAASVAEVDVARAVDGGTGCVPARPRVPAELDGAVVSSGAGRTVTNGPVAGGVDGEDDSSPEHEPITSTAVRKTSEPPRRIHPS